MKKVIVMLCAFVFALGFVNAEVTVDGDSSQNVTVGDVETPVYGVEISWSNLVFDWAYQANSGEYGWEVHPQCVEVENRAEILSQQDYNDFEGTLYTNDACTVEATGYVSSTQYYILSNDNITANVWIVDTSSGGTITPSVAFTPNSNYNYTTMSYTYSSNDGTENTFAGGTLPSNARICAAGDVDPQTGALICDAQYVKGYSITFIPGIDTTKTITTPTSGETIGTLTFTFAAN